MENELSQITGVVDGVIFKNSENGYIVLELDADGHPVTVVGNLGDIVPGEKLLLTGGYITTPKYGEQFKALTCERTLPTSPSEIAKYLGSGIIHGVGLRTATRITDKFGEETLSIIENTPERLKEIKGITIDKAAAIGSAFRKICGVNVVLEFLSKFGISPTTSVAVWNKYDSSSIALIKQNPYLLCEEGIDLEFDAVDAIAEELNVDPFSISRVKAGITYVLQENARIGHTCLPLKPAVSKVVEHLGISRDVFDLALEEGLGEKRFVIHENSNGEEYLYLSPYYRAECYITDRLTQMLQRDGGNGRDFSKDIAAIEFEESITYETRQKMAIQGCLENNVFILTGGPGTGKTTTLNAVIRLLKQNKKLLSLAAPTGRAAKRMSELTNQSAQTIHRLLEVDGTKIETENRICFKKNEENPLKADVIIIDEMSMVDTLLFEALLRAVKTDTKLIIAGDSDQLPSVGAGNILADLIACDKVEQIKLLEIFRQASESLIVTNAHKIVSGYMPELTVKDKDFFFMPCSEYNGEEEISATVIGLVKTRLPAAYGFDPIDDIQVLTPTKMGMNGTRELNKALQKAINPASIKKREVKYGDTVFRVGDKVMQTVNDYNIEWKKSGERGMGIFNGDIGIITHIDNDGMTVNFDGRAAVILPQLFNKIEHAYAITVHKSQGSEYKAVIMPISSVSRKLLYRSLLYTGVTRARDLLILVGKREMLAEMVKNEQKSVRFSCLRDMLENA